MSSSSENFIDIRDIPHLILRDSCKCDQCYIEKTKERKHKLETFDFGVFPIEYTHENDGVNVVWSDSHKSHYSVEDIQKIQAFDTTTVEKKPWEKGFSIPEFSYIEMLHDKKILKNVLETFLIFGIVKILDTPIENKFVESFAYEIACVREIVFDRVADIIIKKEAYTQGFTPVDLPLHTDCSGYRWPPSVFLFHCLENTVEGGENTYSDGLNAALQLQEQYPSSFKTLSENKIGFRLFSPTHDTRSIKPVIELSGQGEIETIRYANWAINPTDISNQYIEYYYRALKDFGNIINEEQINFRLQAGELLFVNNQRVLHGRNSFKENSGSRHFQQVYMEIDDIEAKWRNL